jgi:hypothetical protein
MKRGMSVNDRERSKRKRQMSKKGRKAISAAQKARWTKYHKDKSAVTKIAQPVQNQVSPMQYSIQEHINALETKLDKTKAILNTLKDIILITLGKHYERE